MRPSVDDRFHQLKIRLKRKNWKEINGKRIQVWNLEIWKFEEPLMQCLMYIPPSPGYNIGFGSCCHPQLFFSTQRLPQPRHPHPRSLFQTAKPPTHPLLNTEWRLREERRQKWTFDGDRKKRVINVTIQEFDRDDKNSKNYKNPSMWHRLKLKNLKFCSSSNRIKDQ